MSMPKSWGTRFDVLFRLWQVFWLPTSRTVFPKRGSVTLRLSSHEYWLQLQEQLRFRT